MFGSNKLDISGDFQGLQGRKFLLKKVVDAETIIHIPVKISLSLPDTNIRLFDTYCRKNSYNTLIDFHPILLIAQ